MMKDKEVEEWFERESFCNRFEVEPDHYYVFKKSDSFLRKKDSELFVYD